MFQFTLYTALVISISGFLYQVCRFKKKNLFFKKNKKFNGNKTAFNLKGIVFNTVFQIKLLKAGGMRWGIHFLVFLSFLYLVFFHALDDVTSHVFLNNYEPTIDPYQFLRNLAGGFILIGCVTFLYRRVLKTKIHQENKIKYKGIFSILLIVLVIGSGFLLETAKIISEPVFMEMVEEYSDLAEASELLDLKLFWEKNYHVVFTNDLLATEDKLENGRNLNEEYCLSCHSNVKSAFISGSLAKKFRPMGKILNHYRADGSLYVMHYLLSFLMLASLPFSRLFHMVLIPFASSVSHTNTENFQKNIAFIHTATLYACTNCGYCSQVCSVFPNFQITGNHDILPHSKIESVKAMINNPFALNLNRLKSGNAECTFCRKCTDICPSNIDLQGVWAFLDEQLVAMGYIDNYHFVKNASPGFWTKKENETLSFQKVLTTNLADKIDAFENCVQCTICTNVCPVVEYDSNHNDMTPQQIMNLLRLGKKHLATGTRMVWNCLTCYSCQEHCPEQIKVADILLELRNNGNLMADRINLNPSIDKGT